MSFLNPSTIDAPPTAHYYYGNTLFDYWIIVQQRTHQIPDGWLLLIESVERFILLHGLESI
jgi:hypothetical protein